MLLTLRKGEVLGVYDNPMSLIPAVLPYLVGFGLVFVPDEGHAVSVLRPVRRVQLSAYDRSRPPRVCTGPGMPRPTPAVDKTTTTSRPVGDDSAGHEGLRNPDYRGRVVTCAHAG